LKTTPTPPLARKLTDKAQIRKECLQYTHGTKDPDENIPESKSQLQGRIFQISHSQENVN
jgi:hypothetical protein